jgi:hypothetical protein
MSQQSLSSPPHGIDTPKTAIACPNPNSDQRKDKTHNFDIRRLSLCRCRFGAPYFDLAYHLAVQIPLSDYRTKWGKSSSLFLWWGNVVAPSYFDVLLAQRMDGNVCGETLQSLKYWIGAPSIGLD